MRVLFGHEIFDSQTVEGAARYFVELARHLLAEGVEVQIAVRETNNVFLHESARWSSQVVPLGHANHIPAPVWRVASHLGLDHYLSANRVNRRTSIDALRAGGFDVFHPTYYEPYFLRWLEGRSFVLTVHDMIHELFPEYVKWGNPTSRWKKYLVARATAVIAVSDCTKKDLVRLWQVDPERITVVHHGVGAPFASADVAVIGVQDLLPARVKKYILFVGNRGRYKNFDCLLRAFPKLISQNCDLSVVCVGGGAFTDIETKKMAGLGVARCFLQMPASDEQLAMLYRGAQALVFPSLYEGFGLPILEAFACGCPVILSQASSLAEVAGKAAVFFDPQQPEDLARVVNNLLSSPNHQAALRAAGRARSAGFTWQKSAQATLNVYETALRHAS